MLIRPLPGLRSSVQATTASNDGTMKRMISRISKVARPGVLVRETIHPKDAPISTPITIWPTEKISVLMMVSTMVESVKART